MWTFIITDSEHKVDPVSLNFCFSSEDLFQLKNHWCGDFNRPPPFLDPPRTILFVGSGTHFSQMLISL